MNFISKNIPNYDPATDPVVTVFCAVWHQQKNKLALLDSHLRNLRSQDLPVLPLYIFDNGDTPPEEFDAPWYSFAEPLAIYEAWSAAVALAPTPYVMNLNMDDRLASNAVRTLLGTSLATKSAFVGGEWEIIFDQSHLDEAFVVKDLFQTEFHGDWPPLNVPHHRLGSGTGERGTYGPATMWNSYALGKWYPSYFGNGDKIKSIGDAIFWRCLQRNDGVKMTRLPMIIGKYASDPSHQCEFRPHNDHALLEQFGIQKECFGDRMAAPAPNVTTPPTVEERFFSLRQDPKLKAAAKSQLGQDILALAVSEQKRNGFFVEFGATDGVSLSNTWLLEKEFGWTGILAEPGRRWQDQLRRNRSVHITDKCVWSKSHEILTFQEAEEGEFSTVLEYADSDHHAHRRMRGDTFEVQTISLEDLLHDFNAPHEIDFLSIDTEGSEFEILSHFDFGKYRINAICCEHNFTQQRAKIHDLLVSKGYRRVLETVSKWDDWYVLT